MSDYQFDMNSESCHRFSKDEIEETQEILDTLCPQTESEDYHKGAILNPDFIKDYKERYIWFLNYIKNNKISEVFNRLGWEEIAITKELSPLLESNYEYLTEEIRKYLLPIMTNKDFIRRYGFNEYKPNFEFEKDSNILVLWDFTDDLIDSYLEYKFGVKNSNNKEKNSNDEYYRIGNFEYKNHSLFINDEKIKLFPQELLIMRRFMSDQVSGVKHYNYDDICDIISTKNRTKINNMQKSMSKLRGKINKKTKDFSIESKSGDGYTFVIKNIR